VRYNMVNRPSSRFHLTSVFMSPTECLLEISATVSDSFDIFPDQKLAPEPRSLDFDIIEFIAIEQY
jgi:hypothetical protein